MQQYAVEVNVADSSAINAAHRIGYHRILADTAQGAARIAERDELGWYRDRGLSYALRSITVREVNVDGVTNPTPVWSLLA